tara:strand:+ start:8162 stop:8707 length:546 start_codon:yes stop_codon:yes gene_type:complete
MEQFDKGPFNRGALLNASISACGASPNHVLCFHDLKYLPTVESIQEYVRQLPENTVRHVRSKDFPKFGGVILMRCADFTKVNGFPNDYWGCSGENDELHKRILRAGLRIERTDGVLLNLKKLTPPSPKHQASQNKRWEKMDWHDANPGKDGLEQLDAQIVHSSCQDDVLFHYQAVLPHIEH